MVRYGRRVGRFGRQGSPVLVRPLTYLLTCTISPAEVAKRKIMSMSRTAMMLGYIKDGAVN